MKTKFINVGFEFTASRKKSSKPSSKLESYGHELSRKIWAVPLSKYEWINKRYQRDSCGCEISTPIIKNHNEITTYYKQFNSFVKENNLTTNINESICMLGGCHIHISLSRMSKTIKEDFLRNVARFFTNYPQLNWGFNDPNDTINANSLLTLKPKGKYYDYNISGSLLFRGSLDFTSNNTLDFLSVKPYLNDKYPFRCFIHKPLDVVLLKNFAFRYNSYYNTLEIRIFDMPTSLKQHILHYDVAMAIYYYCLMMTKKKKEIPVSYSDWSDYVVYESLSEAIKKFNEAMKLIGIDIRRTNKMKFNIKTRHEWGREYLF